MANVNGGLVANKNQDVLKHQATVKSLLASPNLKKRFEDILGKKAAGFMSSIINISNSPGLKDCEPMSIISSAVVAATFDLPIDPNLGFSYVVPYKDKKRGKIAQFQMGYKGFIQLAIRSGQYKTINATELYEGDIKKVNKLTGEIELDETNTNEEKVIGYVAYFRLLNGFEKALYMTKEQLEKHGKKYSQSYKSSKQWVKNNSLWTTDFGTMAIKTVLKLLLSKYGILSIEMQKAIETDQALIKDEVAAGAEINSDNLEYIDNPQQVQDIEFEDINDNVENDYTDTPFEEGKND